jgi:hypothetical protein
MLRGAFVCGACPGSRFCETPGVGVWMASSSLGGEALLSVSLSLFEVDQSQSGVCELESERGRLRAVELCIICVGI